MLENSMGPLERRDSRTLCVGQGSTSFKGQKRAGTFRFSTTADKLTTFPFHTPFLLHSVYLKFKAIDSSVIRTFMAYLT